MKRSRALLLLLLAAAAPLGAAEAVAWRPWSEEAFREAARDHKYVILDLEAVWCHWCHVMDATTYRDPGVVALMAGHYVAVRVDQDSRPDLANRYEDYGWPATVVFAPDGSEIVRRRGYLDPAQMASMLQAIVDDPSPGPSVTAGGPTPQADASAAALRERLLAGYRRPTGGWSDEHKFLDADNVEYCLRAAGRGDAEAALVARDMLRLEFQLLDPAWGGAYQYSASGDWVHPHFEKIMPVQAATLRTYALACAEWPGWGYDDAARGVARYMVGFLRGPDGAFFTSQDADLVPGEHAGEYFARDDAGRRALGIPRVDTHSYARENGWAASALCALYGATGDPGALEEALAAASWAAGHRALPGGGFRHGDGDTSGPFLGDTLAMGSAFLSLYGATGDPSWLGRSEAAADFIRTHFSRGAEPGFASSDTRTGSLPRPLPEFDESVALARFANLLGHASGRPSDHELAASALRWAAEPAVAGRQGPYVGGLLLALEELGSEPFHVTVVGSLSDPAARALHAAALRAPLSYKLVEAWDPGAGPAPRGEAIYPALGHPAAFLCANGTCSSPISDPEALARRIAKTLASGG
jgi:uncharacterized protein YyaL (SSP411 family)